MIGRIVDEFRPSRVIEDNDRAAYLSTENPRFRRAWASRARRRRLAVLSAAVSAASVPLFAAAVALPSRGALLFTLAFAVAAFAAAVLGTRLNKATRMSLSYRLLDERQRAERDRSVRFGHRGTTVLLFAGLLVTGAPSFLPWEPVFPAVPALPLLWTLVIAHTSLPALHAAWTQPDEVVDDPDA